MFKETSDASEIRIEIKTTHEEEQSILSEDGIKKFIIILENEIEDSQH